MTDLRLPFPFEITRAAQELGQNIKVARKRRRLLQVELAQKAGVAEKTIRRLEGGDAGVSIGNVLSVLWVLGLISGAKALADPNLDDHGKTLELGRLPKRIRHSIPDNNF